VGRKTSEQAKEQRAIEKERRQRTLLEKLGFAQLMFEFYTAPME
jgi:hypothetical protein